jgi:hypothetical protein
MGINIKRMLNTKMGNIFISIILGLGLAALFRKVCNDRDCIHFYGPILTDIDGKVYKHGEQCYKYDVESSEKCETNKRIVDLISKEKHESFLKLGI